MKVTISECESDSPELSSSDDSLHTESPKIHFQFNGFHAEKLNNYHSEGKNLILSTITTVLSREESFNGSTASHSTYNISIHNEIPIGSGLGSSAVSVIAGIRCAQYITNAQWSRHQILQMALQQEGHPDNVTPSILGGYVTAVTYDAPSESQKDTPSMNSLHFPCEFDERIRALIITPDINISTREAREVLPKSVSLKDATFNMQRAVALTRVFSSQFLNQHENQHEKMREIFKQVLADRWHQSYRANLMPGMTEALSVEMEGLLGSILSGAGPSILSFVLCSDEVAAKISQLIESCFEQKGVRIVKSCVVRVDQDGLVECE